MPDESLLTDDVRALIGRETSLGNVTVTRRAVERAVETYTGRRSATYGEGEPVPGYAIAALEAEDAPEAIPALLPQSILISNEWQFERQLRMGETLSVVNRLVNIAERFGGKFGYSLDFRTEREFRGADGNVVARSVQSMMQYDAASAREGGQE
jgi:hypothetical protein